MNVAPRQPPSDRCVNPALSAQPSVDVISHIHFIRTDADLNNFYEALWGRRTKVCQRVFFHFLFSRRSLGNPRRFFPLRFSFETVREGA